MRVWKYPTQKSESEYPLHSSIYYYMTCYSEPDRDPIFSIYFPVLEVDGRMTRCPCYCHCEVSRTK